MRISIRKGIFETNSSSVHTFSIKPFNGELKGVIGYDNVVIHEEEFGWGPDRYDDCMSKAAYALQVAEYCGRYDEVFEKIEEVFKEAGATNISLRGGGYVDHGGEKGELLDFIIESRQNMIDYLFGSGFILTDSDNFDGYKDRWEEEGLNTIQGEYGKELITSKTIFVL